ncbi:MAG TPA: cupredoxin domain-containing protein [Anaerolineales bacterium]
MTVRTFKLSIVVGAVLLSACSSNPAALELSLKATDFRFEPASMEVMAGQQVTVRMDNQGTLEHDFVIQEIPVEKTAAESEPEVGATAGHTMDDMEIEPAVHMGAMAGLSSSVTFVPTKPGTYEYFCAVPGHKEAGMVGTLIVQER